MAFPLRSAFRRTRLYQVHLSPRTTCRAVDLTHYFEGRPMTTQSPSFNRQFVHGVSWTVTSHRTLRARQGRQAFEARLRRTRAGDWRELGLISLPGLESESGLPESIAASAVGSIQSNMCRASLSLVVTVTYDIRQFRPSVPRKDRKWRPVDQHAGI